MRISGFERQCRVLIVALALTVLMFITGCSEPVSKVGSVKEVREIVEANNNKWASIEPILGESYDVLRYSDGAASYSYNFENYLSAPESAPTGKPIDVGYTVFVEDGKVTNVTPATVTVTKGR